MNPVVSPRLLAAAAALLAISTQPLLLADPGFGLKKKKITLQMRKPAFVRLANTSIAFKGRASNREYGPVLGSLEAILETELVSNERTLLKKSKPEEAEWVLDLTVTGYSTPTAKPRTETNGKLTTTITRWSGSLNVAYQVIDKRGKVHDAGNVTAGFDKEFSSATGTGLFGLPVSSKSQEGTPSDAEDVKQRLVKDVVQQIASNLGNTVQSLEVQMAGGDDNMNQAVTFFEQKLWTRSIEVLEKTAVYAKPEHEAYRQYNLGLAYEALSYDAQSYHDQRGNLFKAQEYYDKATELHRKEKYFVQSVARTKDSVARYRMLDKMAKGDKSLTGPVTPEPTPTPEPADRPSSTERADNTGGPKAVTINDVIEMHGAGVPQPQIVDLIRTSPAGYVFDKDTLIALSRARLPIALVNEMRKKAGLDPLPGTGPRSGGGKTGAPGGKPGVPGGKPATSPAGSR